LLCLGSAFGEVVNVRLARWNHTQALKGFGYVQFRRGAEAEAAVRAENVQVRVGVRDVQWCVAVFRIKAPALRAAHRVCVEKVHNRMVGGGGWGVA
jgi:hypothetical protein